MDGLDHRSEDGKRVVIQSGKCLLMDGQPSCHVCGNTLENQTYQVKEMMFGSGEVFTYLECGACKTLQLLDIPKNLSAYYPLDYYSYGALNTSPKLKQWLKQWRLQLFFKTGWKFLRPIYGDWIKNLTQDYQSKIADIGCGNGQLLYELYASGYRQLKGFDPFIPEEIQVNPHLSIQRKSIFEIEESFDVVMMHHAYEHMDKPIEVMQKAAEILKPNGKLLVRIPVADSFARRHYGVNWVQWDAPRHLFLHTTASIRQIAHLSGLELFKTVYDSSAFQFWGSELYEKGLALSTKHPESQFSQPQMKTFEKEGHQLNKTGDGDQACFYFMKR